MKHPYRLGNGAIVDVQDAQASVAAAQADEVDMANTLQERVVQLESIVGRSTGELARLAPGKALPGVYPLQASVWAHQQESMALTQESSSVRLHVLIRIR